MTTPSQRENIEAKYEIVYAGVEHTVLHFIAASQGRDPQVIYKDLKPIVSGAWALVFQKNLSPEQQQDYYVALMNKPSDWSERGVQKNGTWLDHELSLAAMYAEIWHNLAPKDCDLVVELGCGWGHRLVDMHLRGLDTRYVGGDRSIHSHNIVKAVTAMFPDMKADWFRFDFLKPDFTALPDAKRILILTCHAIEQVTVLGTDMFDALIRRFPNAEIVGAHVEPITFQIDPTRKRERLYAEAKKYNLDLYSIVKSHPALEIVEVDPTLMDCGQDNAAALLVWKTRAP